MKALEGRRALICGATQGIGNAIARAFAKEGAEVVALARSEDRLQTLNSEIKGDVLVADLDDRASLKIKVQGYLQSKGPIHILVNNSSGPPPGLLLEATEDQFLSAFSRHVLASHLLMQLCLPGMQSSGFGRIINIVSTSVREPIPNLGVSNTIRGATASWAKTLAGELPPGVTINNILPGFTNTPRLATLKKSLTTAHGSPEAVEKIWISHIPEGRIGKAEEIANAAVFLASPQAGYVRGVSLAVDGGRMRSI